MRVNKCILTDLDIYCQTLTDFQFWWLCRFCISNDFAGAEDVTIVKREIGEIRILTDRCDYAPTIRITYPPESKGITVVEVNGDYTDSWQEVHIDTYEKIKNYLLTLIN